MNSIIAAKQCLRKQMKTIIMNVPGDERIMRSHLLITKLINSVQFMDSKRIAIYLSMRDEVEMLMLMQFIFENNKLCFIPQYNKDDMKMLKLTSLEDYDTLPKTKWDIKQPDINDNYRENALETGGLDMVVVPGLAFTATKPHKRLGRGKGYYDRFMSDSVDAAAEHGWNRPYFVALAFTEQIVSDLPTSESDFCIDEVISMTLTEISKGCKSFVRLPGNTFAATHALVAVLLHPVTG